MLLWLSDFLQHYIHGFGVFQYITLRAVLAAMTALLISLLFGPVIIKYLTRTQVGQVVRKDGPSTHFTKSGTPTMGGALIIASIIITTLLWSNLRNFYVWVVLLVTLLFSFIGCVDDYRKLVLQNPKGLSAKWKYFWQSVIGLIVAICLYNYSTSPASIWLFVPFFKNIMIHLGLFYIVLTYFVIVGTSNAVNLTDGLDGLAIMPVIMISGALGIFAYVTGNIKFATYLQLPYIHGVGEITIFCGALIGAGLGFLWFNTYPAQIFMGDIGSLGLGAALGVVSVIIRQELVLFIMGGIFVAEAVSVMLQVGSYKLRKKRIFKMAPLHHHFELHGWAEPKIIVRFWIITAILVCIGLATLKLR